MGRPQLVIIPGIGDRTEAYRVFAAVWRLKGFAVHVIPFGWSHYYADIGTKTRDFLYRMDAAAGKKAIYIIGVSAGGTVAVNAYAHNTTVRGVITICSPFADLPDAKNRLLTDSIREARESLRSLDAGEKRSVLSVYGLYDGVVPTHMSRLLGTKKIRLWSVTHGATIFLALTLHSWRLRRFLKKLA